MSDPNWARLTTWLPIATLASSYKEPVAFADETQTVMWYSGNADRSQIEHREHENDPANGMFLFDGDKPRIKSRKIKPAFWAPVEIS